MRFSEPLTEDENIQLNKTRLVVYDDVGSVYKDLGAYTVRHNDRITIMIPSQTDELNQQIEKVKEAIQVLDDKSASQIPSLYPTLSDNGNLIKAGTRIYHNGILIKAVVDLWDTLDNWPDTKPDLWTSIAFVNGIRAIKANASAADAFDIDELGWWDGKVYRSGMAGNVFTPASAPSAWTLVEPK